MCPQNSKNKKICPQNAFTLIELLLVVAVVGTVAGIGISIINPTSQRKTAEDSVKRQNIKEISEGIETFYVVERHYPEKNSMLPTGNPCVMAADWQLLRSYISCKSVEDNNWYGSEYIYNVSPNTDITLNDEKEFCIHVPLSTSTNYIKYCSSWKEIRECSPTDIGDINVCN
jgi:prepilin-type N-terminal cleavage/methylation domain-containing protein